MAEISIASCSSYEPALCRAALEQTIAAVHGLDWVKPGMRVGIKANLVAAMKPESAATTHPALLRALADLLRERGAAGHLSGHLYRHLSRYSLVT